MDKQTDRSYYEEIVRYIRKITGVNLAISSKDTQLIQELIKNKIPVETVKNLIKKEVLKYPPEKRKKFRLSSIEPEIRKFLHKSSKKQTVKNSIPDEFEDTYKKLKKLNQIWKELPEEEKKEIIQQAVEKMKKRFILTNIDRRKVVKSIIREILSERYNIK